MKTEIWKSNLKKPSPEKYYDLPREVLKLLYQKADSCAKSSLLNMYDRAAAGACPSSLPQLHRPNIDGMILLHSRAVYAIWIVDHISGPEGRQSHGGQDLQDS